MHQETISASELERYCYCPLSWWLSLEVQVTSEALKRGDQEHETFSRDLNLIVKRETEARNWEMVVLVFSVIATILGLVGLSLMGLASSGEISAVLSIISIVWIGAALFFLYRSASHKDERRSAKYERGVAVAAIIAMVVALNSVTLLHQDFTLAIVLEVAALVWLIGASLALQNSFNSSREASKKRQAQTIEGDIKYVGVNGSRLLRSAKYGLNGRPDYILELNGELVPVEIKTGRRPKGPLFSHIIQVAAYCLLVSDVMARNVSHGLLRYGDEEHEVEFNEDLRDLVISKLDEMRERKRSGNVHRNHNRPGKCRSCSRREVCPERLD